MHKTKHLTISGTLLCLIQPEEREKEGLQPGFRKKNGFIICPWT
jgi:hypothetical protein